MRIHKKLWTMILSLRIYKHDTETDLLLWASLLQWILKFNLWNFNLQVKRNESNRLSLKIVNKAHQICYSLQNVYTTKNESRMKKSIILKTTHTFSSMCIRLSKSSKKIILMSQTDIWIIRFWSDELHITIKRILKISEKIEKTFWSLF